LKLQPSANLNRRSTRILPERKITMTEQTPAQRAVGDFAPKLVELTDNVLFGDVWERTELTKRDRSLITVASLSPPAVSNSSSDTYNGPRTTALPNPS
jgi:hypothetical protein